MKQKLLALTLTLALSLSLLPVGAAAAGSPYEDIPDNHWASTAVQRLYQAGIMKGTGPSTFQPAGVVTRATAVTLLGRLDNVNTSQYTGSRFDDVAAGSWYAPYVAWASQTGLVNGTSARTFSPQSPVTREQYCAIVGRYLQAKGKKLPQDAGVSMKDAKDISSYAVQSVEGLVKLGLCNRYAGNVVRPKHGLTRVEAAGLISQLYQWLNGQSLDTEIPAENPGGLYACDYLGMTVSQLKTLFGQDLICADYWEYGGSLGIGYSDGRLPFVLYVTDSAHRGSPLPSQRLDMVEYMSAGAALLTPEIAASDTYQSLRNKGFSGELSQAKDDASYSSDSGATATCFIELGSGVRLMLEWYDGKSPDATPPGCCTIIGW